MDDLKRQARLAALQELMDEMGAVDMERAKPPSPGPESADEPEEAAEPEAAGLAGLSPEELEKLKALLAAQEA